MKTPATEYRGYATTRRVTVLNPKTGEERDLDLEKSLRVSNHSPTGFEWGYAGSGPAQLALAILLDYYRDAGLASRFHQPFKFEVIATLSQEEDWTITGAQIESAVLAIQKT